ncbi:uncharacterized protein LOC127799795 [Diospyros lotus]|uniref:uncharacterized protein LOC127799795 n=1 Tax=Diospyros lotus TaxID=55363 RepID=UPI00225B4B9D|nr:uncharacterized protein LOC127799795 [Diospyros lotus]
MGRPVMNDLNLVVSTRALAIKFLTPNGIGYIRGEQYSVRRCYEEGLKMGLTGKKVNIVSRWEGQIISKKGINHDLDSREVDCDRAASPIGELEDIMVSDIDAERCLKLGKSLTLEVIPFGLKNARVIYQRLVNMMFNDFIGKTMEVYVDDMLVKSKQVIDHIRDLEEAFQILRKYQMRLNPLKCSFGVASGKFLGFIVNERGIEANPKKI